MLAAGATDVRRVVGPENLALVLNAYDGALTKAFMVALAASCSSVLPALGMEWRRVRKDKGGETAKEGA